MLPLDGVKVLDLSHLLAGPYCTMVLSDMGAEVTKIEPSAGENIRKTGPHINDESYAFAVLNRNKKSLSLDLKTDGGLEIFKRLAIESDVIVENFRPGVTKRLGIDYDSMQELNPGIIYLSISGYGQTGPFKHKGANDIVAQAFTGFMRMTGHPGGEPTKIGFAVNDIAAGSTALYSILAAYIHKLRTGEGQYIETSLVEAGLAWTIWESASYFGAGEIPEPVGTRHRRTGPYQAYKSLDGYVVVGATKEKMWVKLCIDVVKRPDLIDNPLFADRAKRVQNANQLQQELEKEFSNQTTAYWVELLDQAGIPGGPVHTYDQALNHPLIKERDMILELEHPKMGKIKTLGIPAKFSKTPLKVRTPGPWLGQHSTEILRELGFSEEEISRLYEEKVVFDKYAPGLINIDK